MSSLHDACDEYCAKNTMLQCIPQSTQLKTIHFTPSLNLEKTTNYHPGDINYSQQYVFRDLSLAFYAHDFSLNKARRKLPVFMNANIFRAFLTDHT